MIILQDYRANAFLDLVLAVGDVYSVVAGDLFAHKRGGPFGHVESELVSNDWIIPLKVNKMLSGKTTHIIVTQQSRI